MSLSTLIVVMATLLSGFLLLWFYLKLNSFSYMNLNERKYQLSKLTRDQLFAEYVKNEKYIESAMRKAARDQKREGRFKEAKTEVIYRRELSEIIIQLL